MIRRLASPPAGWNGRRPVAPPGAVDVNEVGDKLAAYWDDDDPQALTAAAWQSYVTAASYEPPAEETNRATIEDRVQTVDMPNADTITGTAAFSVTGSTVAEVRNSAQSSIRDLQRQVKDLARANRRLARLVLRLLDGAD